MTTRTFRPNYFSFFFERAQLAVVDPTPHQPTQRPVNASTQEITMRMQFRAIAIAIVFLGSVGIAAAQNPPGGQQEKLDLSQSQGRMVSQGLSRDPTQPAQGYQGGVGSTPPSSLSQRALPDEVTTQVPETRNMLFIKLPDRILLIDPDSKTVAEIIAGPATTGSDANPANSGSENK
jgi:hypothetical protein